MEIASNIYKKELTTVRGAYDFVSNQKLDLYIGSNSMKDRIIDGLKRVGLSNYLRQIRYIHLIWWTTQNQTLIFI